MENQQFSPGMICLSMMGRELLLNLEGHSLQVTGYNKSQARLTKIKLEEQKIIPIYSLL